MEDTRMTERLSAFINIRQPDIKYKREEFMVNLRKRNKQAIFKAYRFSLSEVEDEKDPVEVYNSDLKQLNLSEGMFRIFCLPIYTMSIIIQ